MKSLLIERLAEHQNVFSHLEGQTDTFAKMAQRLVDCLQAGHKLCLFGNGGSAADAQHIAAELVGRFQRERRALPAIAFTTDTSNLTAIANDYGYDHVFARQVEALCQEGDLVLGISTSGNSPNVIHGIEQAKQQGLHTFGFAGKTGGKLADIADTCLTVPSPKAARTQEAHIFLGHCLCEAVEDSLFPSSDS
ncbi:MAG: D-sedoheptulose 7-phosphate isomerase [Verrucomicrobiota bacterium]